MIDIHTHIMPMLDDGAGTFEEAIAMIRLAYENGTNELALTPHCAPRYGFYHDAQEIREKFAYFKEIVCRRERLPVRLYSGMEVLYEGKERMKRERTAYLTINDSRYLLLEYSFDIPARTFLEGIEWAGECGFIPVVAHPERYSCVQEKWELVREGRSCGACFQISAGSLFGRNGRMSGHTARLLLEAGDVQVVASDAHHLKARMPLQSQTRIWLERNYGRMYTKELLHDNPKRIAADRELPCGTGEFLREE